jgi:sporulation related protein
MPRMASASPTRPPGSILALAVILGLAIGIAAAFLVHAPTSRGRAGNGGITGGVATSTTLGGDFWTVVVASVPSGQPDSRAQADARASALRDLGLDAGVLDSSGYSSLNRGYLVVFSGRFDSHDQAEGHMRAMKDQDLPDGPAPYVREVRH